VGTDGTFAVTNGTTKENVLAEVRRVITNTAITAAWKQVADADDFTKLYAVAATTNGHITGTIVLTMAGTPPTTVEVAVALVIAQ
jgi:hypothetical protein